MSQAAQAIKVRRRPKKDHCGRDLEIRPLGIGPFDLVLLPS